MIFFDSEVMRFMKCSSPLMVFIFPKVSGEVSVIVILISPFVID